LPYVDINIESYPSRRDDMISLSNGRLTVPQIFVNDRHVGGCDDLLVMLASWDVGVYDSDLIDPTTTTTTEAAATTTKTTTTVVNIPLDLYARFVETRPDPVDRRLAPPPTTIGPGVGVSNGGRGVAGASSSSSTYDIDTSRSSGEEKFVVSKKGKEYTCLELTRILLRFMPRDTLWRRGTRYHNAFVGSSGVSVVIGLSSSLSLFDVV
jgi:hypothetical protein